MTVRLDNIGIVVADLDESIAFFEALGLVLDGRAAIDGEWSGRVTGLAGQQVEIAMLTTPDGTGRIELSRFVRPEVTSDHRTAPVNAFGYLRAMFNVDDLDETLARIMPLGAELLSTEIVNYEGIYRLCYVRGPEGVLIGLAESL